MNQGGNIVLGDRGDEESHGESVAFEDDNVQSDQSEDESKDDKSLDTDEPTLQSQDTPYNSVMSFGCQVIWHWNKRKQHIEHEYAISGWALCIIEDVRKDVLEQLTGTYHDAIEKVVSQLHLPPCPNTNPAVSSMSLPEIIDTFGMSLGHFKTAHILIMSQANGQVMMLHKAILTYRTRSIPFHTPQC